MISNMTNITGMTVSLCEFGALMNDIISLQSNGTIIIAICEISWYLSFRSKNLSQRNKENIIKEKHKNKAINCEVLIIYKESFMKAL